MLANDVSVSPAAFPLFGTQMYEKLGNHVSSWPCVTALAVSARFMLIRGAFSFSWIVGYFAVGVLDGCHAAVPVHILPIWEEDPCSLQDGIGELMGTSVEMLAVRRFENQRLLVTRRMDGSPDDVLLRCPPAIDPSWYHHNDNLRCARAFIVLSLEHRAMHHIIVGHH